MDTPSNKEEAIKAICALAMQFSIPLSLASSPPESQSPLSASSVVRAIKDIPKSAEEFASGNDLFSEWYFGQEGVNDLLAKVNNARKAQAQNRTFIGLVQVTMMGKTRLLLKASKCTPLILIRLDNSNMVYERLLSYVDHEKARITKTTTFVQWRSCNRQVMLYIRAFFLSYMLYAREYKNVHKKRLFVPDKLKEVEAEIRLFNASLLNSGQLYVQAIFDAEVEKL